MSIIKCQGKCIPFLPCTHPPSASLSSPFFGSPQSHRPRLGKSIFIMFQVKPGVGQTTACLASSGKEILFQHLSSEPGRRGGRGHFGGGRECQLQHPGCQLSRAAPLQMAEGTRLHKHPEGSQAVTTPRIWKGNADHPELPRGLLNPAQSHAAFLMAGLRPRETGGHGRRRTGARPGPQTPFPSPDTAGCAASAARGSCSGKCAA